MKGDRSKYFRVQFNSLFLLALPLLLTYLCTPSKEGGTILLLLSFSLLATALSREVFCLLRYDNRFKLEVISISVVGTLLYFFLNYWSSYLFFLLGATYIGVQSVKYTDRHRVSNGKN
jgi:hypothetical protein